MDKPLIQLTFDTQNIMEMKLACKFLAPHVDIIAIGKSIVQRGQRGNLKNNDDYGVELIHDLRDEFPDKQISVEIMTADDAERFYEAGANICTISGKLGLQKITNIINVAKQHHAVVQVDMGNVIDKIALAEKSVSLGASIIGLHSNFRTEVSGQVPLAYRQIIASQNRSVKISVNVGINELEERFFSSKGADILALSAHAVISSPTSVDRVAQSLSTLTRRLDKQVTKFEGIILGSHLSGLNITKILKGLGVKSAIGSSDAIVEEVEPALRIKLLGEKTKGRTVEINSKCHLKVDFNKFNDDSTLYEISGETLQKAVEANLEVGFVLYSQAFKIKNNISKIRTCFKKTGFQTPVEFELTAPEKPQICKLWLEVTISERPAVRISIELEVVKYLVDVSEVVLAPPVKLNVDKMIRQAQTRIPPDVLLNIRSSGDAYVQFELRIKRRPVDEKTCHSQKLTLTSLANQLGLYSEEMRKVADDPIWNILVDPMNPSETEKPYLAKALATTTDIGSKLYEWLCTDTKIGKVTIKGIKEVLDKINGLEPGTIIQVNSDGVAIPWEILYPEHFRYDPNIDEQPENVDTAKFWGERFIFETNLTPTLRQLPEGDVDLFELHSKSERKMTVVLNNEIDEEIDWNAEPPVRYHESKLNHLFKQQITQCRDVITLFESDKETGSMIYFFCHGGAEQAFNPNCPEKLQITNNCLLEADRLKCDVVYQDAPIVFLNACSSGALAPISYDSYCSQFSLKGAVGLITTAFAVPAPFAARFGCQLVLEYLKAEKTLGEILFDMRKQALNTHIPIGLFYMLRCPSDIRLKANNEVEE